ncbi:MAG TPA: hypothetical protein VFR07_08600 [Mycobacteriales bacterium]|nr:hypothetical protein [Mycobacteriales bacterium]
MHSATHPPTTTRDRADPGAASRGQLLEAARLGAAVAAADLSGRPDDAATAYASWRRLRRRTDRRPRQLLRVAFDTGYGKAMHTAGATPG